MQDFYIAPLVFQKNINFNEFDNEPVFKILTSLNNFYVKSIPSGNKKEYFCTIRLNTVTTHDDFIQIG